ncbi:MAG: phosphotransferase enzyme family protein [Daejeonella sp.]
MNTEIEIVLSEYGLDKGQYDFRTFGTGHINSTFFISVSGQANQFILQLINQNVFKRPRIIAENMRLVAEYLKRNAPEYLFVGSVPTVNGDEMAYVNGTYWHLTKYIPNSVAFDTLSDPHQAYEAAVQFGRLSKLLNGFDTSLLRPSIPGFHDLNLRYDQFKQSLKDVGGDLKDKASNEIQKALRYTFIVDYFNSYKNSPGFPDRVMHHDTKISNMLFDKETLKGICVIDLDTLMPGKFISDLGDMMRTYLCAFSENERDTDKIFIRVEYFEAVITGYLQEMGAILTATEKDIILFSGKYLIYMQALRFLTDYLNGSIYYPVSYPEQNLDRTINQFKLLSEFFNKEKLLQDIIYKCLNH